MTKEEFIRNAIINRKEDEDLAMCCGVNCNDCPYAGPECYDTIAYGLLDYIIELEKHKETNLEHYWKKLSIGFLSHNNEAYENYRKQCMALFDWLLAPYEEPKPKYKLSKFEYDFLECLKGQKTDQRIYYIFKSMCEKGYFKDIPTSVTINDIIENCEVIDGEID